MNCKHVQTYLSAYLDKELTRSEMLEIRAHVSSCDECQEEEAGLIALKSFLESTPVVEPPADFEDRLLTSVFGDRSPEAVQRQRISYWTLTGVAAAAMICTLLILPSVQKGNETKLEATQHRDEVASDIARHQIYEAIGDPLSPQPIALPNYEKR